MHRTVKGECMPSPEMRSDDRIAVGFGSVLARVID